MSAHTSIARTRRTRRSLVKYCHLLEANGLVPKICEEIKEPLAANGSMMREGTMVDAILIAAPPSIKKKDGGSDAEMLNR